MFIMKFGSASVSTSLQIKQTVKIIQNFLHEKPVLVISGSLETQNQIEEISTLASQNSAKSFQFKLTQLSNNLLQLIDQLFKINNPEKENCLLNLNQNLNQLQNSITTINQNQHLEQTSLTQLFQINDAIYAQIINDYLNSLKISAEQITEIKSNFKTTLSAFSKRQKIPVLNGNNQFASLIASKISATSLQIWSDQKQLNQLISYNESLELFTHNQLINKETILNATENKIPLFIKDINNPKSLGTEITCNERTVKHTIKTIHSEKGISLLTTNSLNTDLIIHCQQQMLELKLLTSSAQSLSIAFKTPKTDQLTRELKKNKEILYENHLALISIIGIGLKGNLKFNTKILDALSKLKIDVKAIQQNGNQNNFTLIIKEIDLSKALQKLKEKLEIF